MGLTLNRRRNWSPPFMKKTPDLIVFMLILLFIQKSTSFQNPNIRRKLSTYRNFRRRCARITVDNFDIDSIDVDSIRAIFANKAFVVAEYNIAIRSVSCEVRLPSVNVLKKYRKSLKEETPTITRRKVFIRDCFKCQYCHNQCSSENLSLDHVLPRAKGVKLVWTNTVTACFECNFKKGQYTLDELKGIGMRLKSLPRVPSFHELQSKVKTFLKGKYHPDWVQYI